MSLVTPQYTLEGRVRFIEPSTFFMEIWRPDRGYIDDWGRADHPGQNCLAGENGLEFEFPEPGPHRFSWGLVRADAAEVRIVADDGQWTSAVVGSEALPGLRPWIGRTPSMPPGHVLDRFEAYDAAGNLLHAARWDAAYDAYPDTC